MTLLANSRANIKPPSCPAPCFQHCVRKLKGAWRKSFWASHWGHWGCSRDFSSPLALVWPGPWWLTQQSQLGPGPHGCPALHTRGSCLTRNHVLLQEYVRWGWGGRWGTSRRAWTLAGPGRRTSRPRKPWVYTCKFLNRRLSLELRCPMRHLDQKVFVTTHGEKTSTVVAFK